MFLPNNIWCCTAQRVHYHLVTKVSRKKLIERIPEKNRGIYATEFSLNWNTNNECNKNGKIEEDIKESEHKKKRIRNIIFICRKALRERVQDTVWIKNNDNNNRQIILNE